MAHRRRWWTCFTSGIVNFVNKSSGCSTVGVWGLREYAKNDAFRNGRGEVGVWEVDKEDSCGIGLKSGWNSADEDGGELDDFRAMRVGPKNAIPTALYSQTTRDLLLTLKHMCNSMITLFISDI